MADTALAWFDIPVTDINRAATFYETVLQAPLTPMDMPGVPMRTFGAAPKMIGALVQSEHNTPQKTGTLIYFTAPDTIAGVLGRVEAAGGSVAMPETPIGEYGRIAQFIDPDGNRIGLHAA